MDPSGEFSGDALMPEVTQAAYARRKKLTKQAINKRVKQGLPLTKAGKINVAKADAWLRANTDKSKQNNRGPQRARKSGGQTYADNRADRESWQAKLAKLQFEERSGTLINADEERREIGAAVRRTRDALLGIPDRLHAEIAAETDPARVHKLLTIEIRQALESLSDGFSK